MPRAYEMKRRAEHVAETRRRITEAAVELHGTVGPARTSITGVADRAGVDRLTVYRHFPNEQALFHACTSHWLTENPFPDPLAWAEIEDQEARLRQALRELYAWYGRNEQMMGNFFRDGPSVPALATRLEEWAAYLDQARQVLARGWGPRGRTRNLLLAVLGHILDFRTWQSLHQQGLDDNDAVDLMLRLAQSTTPVVV